MKRETGTDAGGNFQKALEQAIEKASQQAPAADALMKWKLEEVSGEHGGFVGKNEISVTISYGF